MITVLLSLLLPLFLGRGPQFSDVFSPAQEGFPSIRIPSVILTKNGALIAIAEGRFALADQAANRIIAKRSEDGGRSWGKITLVAEDGDRSLNNPCVLLERRSGRLLLMVQSYPARVSESSPEIHAGYEGEAIVRNYLITSDDDGRTWSSKRDITRETKRPTNVTTIAGGPGIGIQLEHGAHAGRLLFPFNEGPFGRWNIYALFSDDAGMSWQRGSVAPGASIEVAPRGVTSRVNEVQFVERSDGTILANARHWGGTALRKGCRSSDGGMSWTDVEDVSDLCDPGCMASVLRVVDPADSSRAYLLFSGPGCEGRENGTVCLSTDEGTTWPRRRLLWKGSFAYSVLTPMPEGGIGCLFETERRIVFARFSLDYLLGEEGSPGN